MTTEEKAKAYDEAKLRMSAAYNSNRCSIDFMNEIFPELAKSEDERIRKALIRGLKDSGWTHFSDDLTISEIIAWFEKQGEQKSADKIKPKFKVGDWAVSPVAATTKEDAISWIQSIKDRHTWKPSEEQMDNLSRAFNGGTFRTSLLMELYLDLKKLKE